MSERRARGRAGRARSRASGRDDRPGGRQRRAHVLPRRYVRGIERPDRRGVAQRVRLGLAPLGRARCRPAGAAQPGARRAGHRQRRRTGSRTRPSAATSRPLATSILSTVRGNGYGALGGSSMAAPYVTGLVGYLLADDPSLSLADVRRPRAGMGRPSPRRPARRTSRGRCPTDESRQRRRRAGRLRPRPRTRSGRGGWDVELDACDATADGRARRRATPGSVDGELVGSTRECMLPLAAGARSGSYSVTLTVTAPRRRAASRSPRPWRSRTC